MSKHVEIWYLIADGAHARIVRRDAETGAYRQVSRSDSKMARLKTSQIMSDRQGRVAESASSARHAAEAKHDPHRQAKLAFAHKTAHDINEAAHAREFDELVLVAPARVLGEIRGHLDTETSKRVVGELAKDLTPVPDGDLGKHLDVLAHRIERGLAAG